MMVRDMPLSLAVSGRKLVVSAVHAGFGLQRRLADMGLVPGAPVMVISGSHPGPLIIEIKGSRLGLGFGLAQKILVKETADG